MSTVYGDEIDNDCVEGGSGLVVMARMDVVGGGERGQSGSSSLGKVSSSWIIDISNTKVPNQPFFSGGPFIVFLMCKP